MKNLNPSKKIIKPFGIFFNFFEEASSPSHMTSLKSFNPSPPKNILAITEITSTTRTKSQPFTKKIQPLAKKCQPLPKEISTPPPPHKKFSNLLENYSTPTENFSTTLEIPQAP